MREFLNWLFLVVSILLFIGSTIGFILGVAGIWPKNEPPVILAISWGALQITAFGNIVTAIVNRKVDKDTFMEKILKKIGLN